MKPWKRIEPTTVTKVGWRTVVTKTFVDGRGNTHTFDTYCKENQEFAAIIALAEDNKVIIGRQFRVGPERIMDELPGGFVDADDPDKEATMGREMLEETGYQAGVMEYLGPSYKDTYMNAVWHVFFATGCKKVAEPHLEHEEEIEVDLISIPQLLHNARHGKMTDAAAVLMAYDRLMKIQENV